MKTLTTIGLKRIAAQVIWTAIFQHPWRPPVQRRLFPTPRRRPEKAGPKIPADVVGTSVKLLKIHADVVAAGFKLLKIRPDHVRQFKNP